MSIKISRTFSDTVKRVTRFRKGREMTVIDTFGTLISQFTATNIINDKNAIINYSHNNNEIIDSVVLNIIDNGDNISELIKAVYVYNRDSEGIKISKEILKQYLIGQSKVLDVDGEHHKKDWFSAEKNLRRIIFNNNINEVFYKTSVVRHTSEILSELGFKKDDILELIREVKHDIYVKIGYHRGYSKKNIMKELNTKTVSYEVTLSRLDEILTNIKLDKFKSFSKSFYKTSVLSNILFGYAINKSKAVKTYECISKTIDKLIKDRPKYKNVLLALLRKINLYMLIEDNSEFVKTMKKHKQELQDTDIYKEIIRTYENPSVIRTNGNGYAELTHETLSVLLLSDMNYIGDDCELSVEEIIDYLYDNKEEYIENKMFNYSLSKYMSNNMSDNIFTNNNIMRFVHKTYDFDIDASVTKMNERHSNIVVHNLESCIDEILNRSYIVNGDNIDGVISSVSKRITYGTSAAYLVENNTEHYSALRSMSREYNRIYNDDRYVKICLDSLKGMVKYIHINKEEKASKRSMVKYDLNEISDKYQYYKKHMKDIIDVNKNVNNLRYVINKSTILFSGNETIDHALDIIDLSDLA